MNSSYRTQLNRELKKHLALNGRPPRLVIVGIGNELNGDDGAGLICVRRMARLLPENQALSLVEGSIAPENYTAPIRAFAPDWVWLLDAADMGMEPGTVKLIALEEVGGVSAFTHGLPPTLFATFLREEIGANVFLFGVQPWQVEAFTEMSETVKTEANSLAGKLSAWVKKYIIE